MKFPCSNQIYWVMFLLFFSIFFERIKALHTNSIVTYKAFAAILGFDYSDRERVKIQVYDPPADVDWSFMYADRYTDQRHGVQHGRYYGMIPYFRVLNNMIRRTLTPKVGDHNSILSSTKVVMFAMREGEPPFRVFDFL